MSAERLLHRGLFGVIVRSASDASGQSQFRHIHPSECAALVGLDPAAYFGDHVLLTLSGIGQIASPIQAAWVGPHVINHFTWLKYGIRTFEPVDHLNAYRSWILARCQIPWPCPDVMDRTRLTQDAMLWSHAMLEPLPKLLQRDEWDFTMSERCLAAALYQLRERQPDSERELAVAAITQIDAPLDLTDEMSDSDEPEPEALLPVAEPPKFHVVSVPDDCAAILYPPAHDVAFVRLSPQTTVQHLLEAEGRLYGFDWTQVTAFKMDGSPWDVSEVLQPGHMAQLCVIPRGQSGDPEYLVFRPHLHGFPSGQRPLPIMPSEPSGESGLLPFRLPVNEAAEAVCVGHFPLQVPGVTNHQSWQEGISNDRRFIPSDVGVAIPTCGTPPAPGVACDGDAGESGPLPFRLPVDLPMPTDLPGDDALSNADDDPMTGVPHGHQPDGAFMTGTTRLAASDDGECRPLPCKLPASVMPSAPAQAVPAHAILAGVQPTSPIGFLKLPPPPCAVLLVVMKHFCHCNTRSVLFFLTMLEVFVNTVSTIFLFGRGPYSDEGFHDLNPTLKPTTFLKHIHVASRRQPPAPHRWAAARNCQ